jgi:drug/metabolite transporter (DMT)-like permease
MVIGLGAALLAAVVFGVGAVVQAIAARGGQLVSRLMALVALAYVIGWLLHVVSIAMLPLYVAQVGISASLAVTAVTAAALVGEPLAARHRLAVGVLVAGLALLATAAGPVGHHRFDAAQTVGLYVALALTLVLGLMAMRVSGQRGGLLLGCLGGVAYAGSPIATRSLVDPAWEWLSMAPALTIGLFGLLGFWLYSVALQRASVIAASAPLVLLQTVLPAIAGVLMFGDGFRAGWWPLAAVGFVASIAAALVLSDVEVRLDHLDEQEAAPLTGCQPG